MENRLENTPGGVDDPRWLSTCVLHGVHGIMQLLTRQELKHSIARMDPGFICAQHNSIFNERGLMNIYFSCSLTGGRADEAIYGEIVDHLLSTGHEVPTAHLARPEVMKEERVVDAGEVYLRDVQWIEGADCIIAEVSTPSHGVGYEIAYGLERGKRVLCCYRQGTKVSKMITGNNSPGLKVVSYHDPDELISMVDQFLNELDGG